MTAVEVLHIEETGPDFVRLRNDIQGVRINFADDEMFSKEESAGFFRGLKGEPAAIPVDGPFFIAVISGGMGSTAASRSYRLTLRLRPSSGCNSTTQR